MCATMQKLRMCSSFNGCLWVVGDAAEERRNITVKTSFPGARKKKEGCFRSPLNRSLRAYAYCRSRRGTRAGSDFVVGGGGAGSEGLSCTIGVGGGGACLGASGTRAGGGASERGSGRYSRTGCTPVAAAGSARGVVTRSIGSRPCGGGADIVPGCGR